MAFVVATGLDLGTADSYVSLSAVDAYFEAMLDVEWAALSNEDDKRMWLLRLASTVINQRYRWIDTTPYVSVPRPVAIATFELAKHFANPDTTVSSSGSSDIKKVQVGAIAVEYGTSATATSATPETIYSFIDMILSTHGEVRVATAGAVDNGWSVISVARA